MPRSMRSTFVMRAPWVRFFAEEIVRAVVEGNEGGARPDSKYRKVPQNQRN